MNMTIFDIHSHVHGMKYEHTITCGHHDIMTSIAYEYCMLLSALTIVLQYIVLALTTGSTTY